MVSGRRRGLASCMRPPTAPADPDGLPGALLVVEDHRSVRLGLRLLLLGAGLPVQGVQLAADLAQARAALAAGPIALVLLDLDLAGECGLDLLPQIPPGAWVVVHSALVDAAMAARIQAAGIRHVVTKGGPAAELVHMLRGLLCGPRPA